VATNFQVFLSASALSQPVASSVVRTDTNQVSHTVLSFVVRSLEVRRCFSQ